MEKNPEMSYRIIGDLKHGTVAQVVREEVAPEV